MLREQKALQEYNKTKNLIVDQRYSEPFGSFTSFPFFLFSQTVATTVAGDLHHFAVLSYYHKVPLLDLYSTFIT